MDIIRVLRILEYEGPRDWVEETLRRRGVKGEQRIGADKLIREAIIGEFPATLKETEGGSFEYFCYKCGQIRLSLDMNLTACRSCGDQIVLKGTPGSLNREALKREFKEKQKPEGE